MARLYDAHNHLQDAWFTPHRPRVFADLATVGVVRVVVNGTCETDWPDVAALAQEAPAVFPSYGLHPWDVGNRTPDWRQKLLARFDANPGAGVGEIGLDRWILESARPDDPRLAGLRRAPLAEQLEIFAWQLALAAERNLPASIHCLEAFGPLLDTLRAARLPARGFLLHAYSGSAELAKDFAALGAYFSFNGAFLPAGPLPAVCHLLDDKRSNPAGKEKNECHLIDDIRPKSLRRLALFAQLPADRLLVETDAPAMRLPPAREKFSPLAAADGALANHPANLATTYAALAELRTTTVEALAGQVEENFLRLFGPAQPPPSTQSFSFS